MTQPLVFRKNRRNNGANEGNNSPLENYKVIFRRNNGANESNNSPLENYKVIFRRSTPKGGGGLNLIIAECSPLKT